jgi:stage V sporulation protein S
MENLFRVSSTSHPTAIAGAIAGTIRDGKPAILQAIGAGSVNQTVKAIVVARGYLAGDGISIICMPAFVELEVDGKERTALRFHVDQPGRSFPPATAIPPRAAPVNGRDGT